jgi:hypothetical protein
LERAGVKINKKDYFIFRFGITVKSNVKRYNTKSLTPIMCCLFGEKLRTKKNSYKDFL